MIFLKWEVIIKVACGRDYEVSRVTQGYFGSMMAGVLHIGALNMYSQCRMSILRNVTMSPVAIFAIFMSILKWSYVAYRF